MILKKMKVQEPIILTPPIPNISDVDKPKIISRAEWGARNPKYDYSNHPYFNKMTLHHAAAGEPDFRRREGSRETIQEFHQDGRGGAISAIIFWWIWRVIFTRKTRNSPWRACWRCKYREYRCLYLGLLSSTSNQYSLQ